MNEEAGLGVGGLALLGALPLLGGLCLYPEYMRQKAEKAKREAEEAMEILEESILLDPTDIPGFVLIHEIFLKVSLARTCAQEILEWNEDLQKEWNDIDHGYETRYD